MFELEIKTNSLDDPQTIKWSSRDAPQVDFDALHIQISEKVADKLAAMLESNERVPWGASGFICDTGVEVRVKTGSFTSEMRFIPWSEIGSMVFRDAKLVMSYGTKECCVEIPCAEPNLFAGFLLIDRKMKDLYGDWLPNRQSDEELAYAMAERPLPWLGL